MKTKLILFGIIITAMFFLTKCIGISNIADTTGVEVSYLNSIPENSEKIILTKNNTTPDILFEETISALLSRGHRIQREDENRYYITTEGKDVGESTLQRMVFYIKQNGDNSVMEITTEWSAGHEATAMASAMSGIQIDSSWQSARWESSTRLGIAFAESVAVALKIEDANISYE